MYDLGIAAAQCAGFGGRRAINARLWAESADVPRRAEWAWHDVVQLG